MILVWVTEFAMPGSCTGVGDRRVVAVGDGELQRTDRGVGAELALVVSIEARAGRPE